MTEMKRYNNLYNSLLENNQLIHVGKLLQRAANNWPNNTIVICNDQKITYQELYSKSIALGQRLKDIGVKPNDIVILYYENSIEFYIAYFAIWHIGAIVAPLNVFLTNTEVAHIVKDAEPAAIIVSDTLKSKLDGYKKTLPALITNINRYSLNQKNNIEIVNRNIDDVAAILYTSGTTGFPKGVMLSSKNIIINTIQGISRLDVSHNDIVYCPLPLFHSLPQNICVWANTVLGSTAIITSKIDRKALLNGLKYKPSIIIGVPALYGLFCKMKTVNFGNVRYYFSGGDTLSDKLRAFFGLIYRRKLCNGYGLTETSPFLCVDTDDYIQPTNTVGKPFIGIQCSIRDSNENELSKGQIGTLWVKGENVMKGYYKAKEATDAVLKDGWFNTGDLAYIDKNGKIVLTGREKDLIKHKGINIFPQEIENILLTHPKVMQVAVVGIKDTDEEIPIAFVASDESDNKKLEIELLKLCKQNLASYKIPRKFIIKKTLYVTTTGKVNKKKLKAELKAKNNENY